MQSANSPASDWDYVVHMVINASHIGGFYCEKVGRAYLRAIFGG